LQSSTVASQLHILQNHELFAELSAQELGHLLTFARIERYRPKQHIFLKGSPGDSMMAVLSGAVRISSVGADGREIVLNTMHPGEVFGEIALLDGKERTADATAAAESTLMVILRRDFLPFLRDHPDVAIRLLRVICERLRRTTEQVEDLLFLNLPSRLAKKLVELARASRDEHHLAEPTIRHSQREIGTMIGLSRESINKQLSLWQRDHVIAIRDGVIVVHDVDLLRRVAENG
jgi:CRP-like cAMP-binding protein